MDKTKGGKNQWGTWEIDDYSGARTSKLKIQVVAGDLLSPLSTQ